MAKGYPNTSDYRDVHTELADPEKLTELQAVILLGTVEKVAKDPYSPTRRELGKAKEIYRAIDDNYHLDKCNSLADLERLIDLE